MRESPALRVVELMRNWGMRVDYHDPYVPVYPKGRHGDLGMASVELNEETIQQYDAAFILTDHQCVDYQWIVDHIDLVVDTRNAAKDVVRRRDRIVKA